MADQSQPFGEGSLPGLVYEVMHPQVVASDIALASSDGLRDFLLHRTGHATGKSAG